MLTEMGNSIFWQLMPSMKRNISYIMFDSDEFPRKVARMSLSIFLSTRLSSRLEYFSRQSFLEDLN
jgi:hypothetical protein